MIDREAMQMALEALKKATKHLPVHFDSHFETIAALRTALEQQAEPTCPDCKAKVLYECVACSSNNYPPQRKPLTEEQIEACYETAGQYQSLRPQDRFGVFALARAIEAAHGIKGEA